MYLSIIVLPLLGSIFSGLFGRKLGVSGSQLVTTSLVMVTTLLSILAFFEVGLLSVPVSIELFTWIDSESLDILWGFRFDSLTVSCGIAFSNCSVDWNQLYKRIYYNKLSRFLALNVCKLTKNYSTKQVEEVSDLKLTN